MGHEQRGGVPRKRRDAMGSLRVVGIDPVFLTVERRSEQSFAQSDKHGICRERVDVVDQTQGESLINMD